MNTRVFDANANILNNPPVYARVVAEAISSALLTSTPIKSSILNHTRVTKTRSSAATRIESTLNSLNMSTLAYQLEKSKHIDDYSINASASTVNDQKNNSRTNSSGPPEYHQASPLSGEMSREYLKVPLYHRAFPTHHYEQSVFWHTFGSILTITLVIFFS